MRLFLEFSNESYRHFVDTHKFVSAYLDVWLCLRHGGVLPHVETAGNKAPGVWELSKHFFFVRAQLLVRLRFPLFLLFQTHIALVGSTLFYFGMLSTAATK